MGSISAHLGSSRERFRSDIEQYSSTNTKNRRHKNPVDGTQPFHTLQRDAVRDLVTARVKEEERTMNIVKLEPTNEAALLSISTWTRFRQTNDPVVKPVKPIGDCKVQCTVKTKRGHQCKNQAKLRLPTEFIDSMSSSDPVCTFHRNLKKGGADEGFTSVRTKEKVLFSDYIPDYCYKSTRAALKAEMGKSPKSDPPGFVYAFQIRDPKRFIIKIGLTTGDLMKRLGQWKKECPESAQNLVGWWPGNIMTKNFKKTKAGMRCEPGPKGVYAHKLERLIHLELADITFAATRTNDDSLDDSSEPISAIAALQKANGRCSCGTNHKEIFSFDRPKDSGLTTEEWDGWVWEEMVMPVIYKWGWFVTLFY